MQTDHWQARVALDARYGAHRGKVAVGSEAAMHMVESGRGGVIINISSISRAGNVGQTNCAAAKGGVAAMTVIWAKELARSRSASPASRRDLATSAWWRPYRQRLKRRSSRPFRCGASRSPRRSRAPRSSSCRTTTSTVGFWRSTADCGYDRCHHQIPGARLTKAETPEPGSTI
jgi:NAD(P)-dependent dehydrogenase (short-subunit alcohol dehydrogenase family)